MRLLWKLLRRHVSPAQLGGFFAANLLGMLIVLLSFQFYRDVRPLFGREDGFLKADYLILSKRISATGLWGETSGFSAQEIDDLQRQPFCRRVGAFTASQYRVSCSLGLQGIASFGTEMFFESVPDDFIDVDLSRWTFNEAEPLVPIILPRSYLAIYNFGFAQSQSLPKLSEGVVGMIDLGIQLRGAGREEQLKGSVIGFSSRLNTILVPESFIRWSNERFAPGSDTTPSRLIMEVGNPADDAIVSYMDEHGYELEDDKLDAGRTTYFLRIVAGIVMAVGLLISLLSFYILMLSIYLLVQKNAQKLHNLLLIGYSPARVARPYQLLTITANALVLIIALAGLCILRHYYMERLWTMFPQMPDGSLWPSVLLGLALFVLVVMVNVVVVYRRVMKIWNS
ncbi:MAG: ABC transporter permease [Bacteroidaceae bacterium]|nr:ABC transporter permease [Bacteroidaceae bacterium]